MPTQSKILKKFKLIFVLCSTVVLFESALSQTVVNKFIQKNLDSIGFDEKLGEYIYSDDYFALSNGDSVKLKNLFGNDKPIILNPVYYECPMLCGLVLNGLLKSASKIDWSPGKEYNIITFSINPNEKQDLAKSNKSGYIDSLKRTSAKDGWFFLTGNEKAIQRLTNSFGFKYYYDERINQFNHPAGIVVLSPQGKITRYLYGIDYESIQLKKALSEAVEGKIGTTADKLILYCYSYDPDLNSYVPVALNIMKLGGVIIMLFLGLFLGVLWFKEKYSSTKSKT